ncbi:MAG: PAS domain-containing protein [Verrucomicrobiota bacterium]|nr:PAS domain-containing protein [Verrucomicrobiota bacterium]
MRAGELDPPNKPIRVLLIDDDQDSFILTKHHLSKIQSNSLHLEWASSYEKGYEGILAGKHDVFLLDYRLGGRNGLELLREALANGCKAPIIMLTSENPQVDAQAMQLGAADFLSKDKLDSALLERSIRYSIKHYNTLKALRESESQLTSFMQNVPCAVFMKNLDGRYVYANESCQKMFQKQELVGKSDAELLPKHLAQKFKNLDQQVLTARKAVQTTETLRGEDGPRYWLTTRFPIMNDLGETTMFGGAALEITETKRLEKEIQEISETEKRRIGQDLHDGLGQSLTGIACMVKVIEQKLGSKGLPEAGDARRITSMVNETIQQTRDLARGLCPVELETNGLQAALQELVTRVEKLFNVKCELAGPTFVQVFDNSAAVHLYRIAQEAINNAIKHGNATMITVSLMPVNNQLQLIIQDNGCGLPRTQEKPRGMGLRVMNYRAGIIGATVTVQNGEECGTIVKCVMTNNDPRKQARRPAPKPALVE